MAAVCFAAVALLGFITPVAAQDAGVWMGDRRAAWLKEAAVSMPELRRTEHHPVRIVRSVADSTAFQGWRMEPSEPIEALSHAAQEVSRGNFDEKIDEEIGWGEFKQLIASFNKMTADLKDYQVLQLQAQVSEMKEQVFRSVAHDLRAPLLGLQGYLYILQSGKASPQEQKEYLEQMSQAARNLSSLLEDVLDVSRVQAGMMSPKKQSVDVPALLKNVTDTLAPSAKEKKLALSFETSVNHLPADPKLLQRVVMNLVSNAVKFTETGFVRVRARQDEKAYYIVVEDSGIGISETEMKGLFQKYHQVRPDRPGYGLGLFISRQIVQAHGGTLDVTSQPGQGSAFTVRLPKETK